MTTIDEDNLSDEDLQELEDKLLEEEFEDRKDEMAVSGRSVFEIQKLKREGKKNNKEDDIH